MKEGKSGTENIERIKLCRLTTLPRLIPNISDFLKTRFYVSIYILKGDN